MKLSLYALLMGFLLDLLLGDPKALYHPVRAIGKTIELLEYGLRKIFRIQPRVDAIITAQDDGQKENATKAKKDARIKSTCKREYIAGVILAVLVLIVSAGIPLLILVFCQMVHPYLRLAIESLMCWQLLATKSLKDESMKVYQTLMEDDLSKSRKAVSMIVGRVTESLDKEGVAKAAVETVAENASDGVTAPLFYMMIGGATLGFFYKAINTMDSMIGYKNDRYLYFGRFAAKLDDVVNFIPSRLCARCMIVATSFCRLDKENAKKIYKRDRLNHASPNSAQTEAVMAGALNVQLAGDAWYFGKLCEKKTIGDDNRPVVASDIVRANALLYASSVLALSIMTVIKWVVILLIGIFL